MSNNRPNWKEALSKETIIRELELMAIPVDFDQLCKNGILKRVGKKRFKILDLRRLPKYVRTRINIIDSDGIVEFEDTVEWAKNRLSKLEVD
jgi:hypothetical protein